MRIMYILRPSETIGGDHLAAEWHSFAMMEIDQGIEAVISVRALTEEFNGCLPDADVAIMWSGCSPDWGLPAAKAVKDSGKKLIIVPNWWNRERRQNFFQARTDVADGYLEGVKEVLSLADVLAVCTMSEAQECWKLVPRAKVFIMGQGPGKVVVTPKPPEDYVVCCGRIEPHKNQYILAAACRELSVPLVLLGPVMNKNYLEMVMEQGAHITCMGQLERREAQEILSRARVHALPSFSETPGLSNSEALALGVPAVMGNIGAECEFYRDMGIYCTPESVEDVAAAIGEAWQMKRQPQTIIQTWGEAASRTWKWIEDNE